MLLYARLKLFVVIHRSSSHMTNPNRNKHYRVVINRGFGNSNDKQQWIVLEEVEPHVFKVVANNLTDKYMPLLLGFTGWDNEVVDLDAGDSDESQCFGMSDHLRWNDVDLTPREFNAPSIKRLKQALEHVEFGTWDPWDI